MKIVDKDSTDVSDMASELRVMAALSHPNIVAFKEVFDHDTGYYVVLELISGGELFDRIVELRRFTERDAAQTMRQAFQAVQHMHSRHYVHRDIKPENLLLSDKSADAVVKLADFGFATECRSLWGCFDLLGTPEYMGACRACPRRCRYAPVTIALIPAAPELVAMRDAHSGYGKPVDVWALGVVLYILLSGVHPFQMEDDAAMLDNIQAGRWKWLGRNWVLVSDEAKDLITRMLEKEPRSRLTVDECLAHAWFKSQGDTPLSDVTEELKKFQARKRLRVRARERRVRAHARLGRHPLSHCDQQDAPPARQTQPRRKGCG